MKKAIFASTLVLSTYLFTSAANASCATTTHIGKPNIPQGDTATYSQMEASHNQVTNYVKSMEALLSSCSSMASIRYNFYVHRINNLASDYNVELKKFYISETN